MPQPATTPENPSPPEHLHLEDVLGDIPISYPIAFYANADDEAVEREAIDQEILAELVSF